MEVVEPLGAETFLNLATGASSFIARLHPTSDFLINQCIDVTSRISNAHLFDAESGNVLK